MASLCTTSCWIKQWFQSLVNRSTGIAKNEILNWKKCLHQKKGNGRIIQKSIMVSSRTGSYSKEQWLLLQAIRVNIQPADLAKRYSFLHEEIRQSAANAAFDRQLLQGATGQQFPANALTAVGDRKHLDRLDWSKRQRKTYCTSLFSFIFLQDLLRWPRSSPPCKS